jgi:hypothetical protein
MMMMQMPPELPGDCSTEAKHASEFCSGILNFQTSRLFNSLIYNTDKLADTWPCRVLEVGVLAFPLLAGVVVEEKQRIHHPLAEGTHHT